MSFFLYSDIDFPNGDLFQINNVSSQTDVINILNGLSLHANCGTWDIGNKILYVKNCLTSTVSVGIHSGFNSYLSQSNFSPVQDGVCSISNFDFGGGDVFTDTKTDQTTICNNIVNTLAQNCATVYNNIVYYKLFTNVSNMGTNTGRLSYVYCTSIVP